MSRDTAPPPADRFPVWVESPVAWGEMDAFRHVNNTVFFRYLESARIEYLVRIGFGSEEEHGGVGPILASTGCRFRRPLVFPDTVRVGARTREVGEDRFALEYRVMSIAQERVVAEGEGVVVAYDYSAGRKAPLPPAVRRAIGALESGAGAMHPTGPDGA